MTTPAFELGEEIKLRTLEYKLLDSLWDKYNHATPLSAISFQNWKTIKYLSADGKGVSDDIDKIPDDKGGLYMFYIKCPIIAGMTEFPCYIGRAQLTQNQNLRKRCKEYFSKYYREKERPKITKMFAYWGKHLHLSYLELNDNQTITDLEAQLIDALLLPLNDQLTDTEIRTAVKAFQA